MKKLLILLSICAVAAIAQAQDVKTIDVKASWQAKESSRLWVNEPSPPNNLQWGLSVWLRTTATELRVRIKPNTGSALETDIADLPAVGNNWYYVLLTDLSVAPDSVTIAVMRWTDQPPIPVVAASDPPSGNPDCRENGIDPTWQECFQPVLAEVHTAQPGQSVFAWHLTADTPLDMVVLIDGDEVEFQQGGTGIALNKEMTGGEQVTLAER